MKLFSDSIGRKVVMAVTGLLMVLFVIGHLLGNLSIFAGPNGINSYAQHLRDLAPLVWGTRIVMGVSVILHVILALVITTENWAAKPTKYAVKRSLRATFAGKTMIWTGIIIAVFVGYHLLQFTFHVTPGLTLGQDLEGRFDVFTMVVNSFVVPLISIIYVVAMISLFLHLSHGIQSTFQTIGVANAKLLPRFGRLGNWASVIFLVGFGAIPLTILFGILAR